MRLHRHADTPRSDRPEDERLPLGKSYVYGLQHILTMYGGVIAPPLIIGGAAGLTGAEIGLLVSAALFVSGAATLLQTLGVPYFGAKLPLVQGISFASVSTLVAVAAGPGGIRSAFGAIIVAGAIGILLSPFFCKVVRFFPSVVTGSIITVIGISLLPVAVRWAMGGVQSASDWGSLTNIGLAFFTLVVILLISRLVQGPLSRLSILLGIVIGTAFAALIGEADFGSVDDGAYFALPQPFAFGSPIFEIGAIVSMVVVILVIMTETTADILAVGEIVGTKVDSRRVGDGLRADMLATTVAPVFGTFPASAFAQNVGLVAITGIKSRFVVAAGGSVLLVLGLFPVLGRIVSAVPLPVLGGAGIVLFGSVAASGIRTLARVSFDGNLNLVIVAVTLGFGVIPIAVPDFYHAFPSAVQVILDSGISAASIVAVLLNLLFNELKLGQRRDPSVAAAAPPIHVDDVAEPSSPEPSSPEPRPDAADNPIALARRSGTALN